MPISHEEARRRHRESRRKSNQLTYQADRDGALDAYGGKCEECGTRERSELMVVREYGSHWGQTLAGQAIKSGAAKFRWLRQRGYPGGFVLKCRTCKPRHLVGGSSHARGDS